MAREALSWCQVKYHWQGRSRAGLDCLGLPVVVAEALGLVVGVEVPRYRPPLPARVLVDGLRRYLVERAHPRKEGCAGQSIQCCGDCREQLAGTVVVIGRNELHCGIPTDDGRLVAVTQAHGCHAVEYSAVLLRATRHVFEFPGVNYGS